MITFYFENIIEIIEIPGLRQVRPPRTTRGMEEEVEEGLGGGEGGGEVAGGTKLGSFGTPRQA